MLKLNVLLAKTDALASNWKNNIKDMIKFFKSSQSQFLGEKKTYTANPNTVDDPSKRNIKKIVTTVDEKFDWFVDTQKPYLDALFSQEATNASGIAKAALIVDGYDFGMLSSLELLRLKSIIENGEFKNIFEEIPVRSDSEIWNLSTNDEYAGRAVYESPLLEGVAKSIVKTNYILEDPNVALLKDSASYKPQVAQRDSVLELGTYTVQKYSGEYSHLQRASILKRISSLHTAVVEALKKSNEVEAVQSELTGEKFFTYLLGE